MIPELCWVDSNTPKEIMYEFCKTSVQESKTSASNYTVEHWETSPETLMYKLYVDKIYDKENRGGFLVSCLGDVLLAGAGVCQWNDEPDTCIFLSRLYTNPNHRSIPEARIIHIQFPLYEYAESLGYKGFISTLNEYNKRLMDVTFNTNNPDSMPRYFFDNGKHYTSQHGRRFIPVKRFDKTITLNYTKQWVLYYGFESDHEERILETLERVATNG